MSETNNGQLEAMLVSLRFGLPRQSRQDKQKSRKVEQEAHAQKGVSRYSVFYFQHEEDGNKADALESLKAFFNAWRSEHNRLTRPWDGGTRLLPAPLVERYMQMDTRMKTEAPIQKTAAREAYPDWKITAPTRMGQLYEPENFPTLEEFTEDISWDSSMIPLPVAAQWRQIKFIAPNISATLEATTNERIVKAVAEAHEQTWKDVLQPIQHIVDTLSKNKPRIFDSLIGNLTGILELVPAFNIAGDSQLNQLAKSAQQTLAGINPDDLRTDPDLRKQTLKNAQGLLAKFGELGTRKFA